MMRLSLYVLATLLLAIRCIDGASIRINLGNAKIGGKVRINAIQKGFDSATIAADKAQVKGSTTVTKIKAKKVVAPHVCIIHILHSQLSSLLRTLRFRLRGWLSKIFQPLPWLLTKLNPPCLLTLAWTILRSAMG